MIRRGFLFFGRGADVLGVSEMDHQLSWSLVVVLYLLFRQIYNSSGTDKFIEVSLEGVG